MASVAEQLQSAREELVPVAGELAALEARLLAQHAWGMAPEVLVRDAMSPIDAEKAEALAALVSRRCTHEPIAQILGAKHFWKDQFTVTSEVLTPRADSETLIELCLKLKPSASCVLDLGTGSGCLLLSLLREYGHATGVAVDRSAPALTVAKSNARNLGLEARASFVLSNWCEKLDKSARFDMVVANPPYIPRAEIARLAADVREHEPKIALDGGEDGLDCYRAILSQLAPHLAQGALVVCEIGQGQAEMVTSIAREQGYELKGIAKDLAGTERAVALTLTQSL